MMLRSRVKQKQPSACKHDDDLFFRCMGRRGNCGPRPSIWVGSQSRIARPTHIQPVLMVVDSFQMDVSAPATHAERPFFACVPGAETSIWKESPTMRTG